MNGENKMKNGRKKVIKIYRVENHYELIYEHIKDTFMTVNRWICKRYNNADY